MIVVVKKINHTGQRYLTKDIIGKVGRVLGKVHHHGREWIRVGFKGKKNFSTMCFGSPYYDFLEDELEKKDAV